MKRFATIILLLTPFLGYAQKIRVGAKHFNEGYIISEIISQLLEDSGFEVTRVYNLGGTLVCFEALKTNAIDLYPEYTGTIASEILHSSKRISNQEISKQLQDDFNLEMSMSFGFNNSYGLVMLHSLATAKKIVSISDLQKYPDAVLGLSYEFLKRNDGWENLAKTYRLGLKPKALEHGLAYEALRNSKIEITDAYTTDGEILMDSLTVLKDDLNFFPRYEAIVLYSKSLSSDVKEVVSKLEGKITESEIQKLNASILFEKKNFDEVARKFLASKNLIRLASAPDEAFVVFEILSKTFHHLLLTFAALVIAIAFAVPAGVYIYWHPSIAKPVLYLVGIFQTIPSIALLAMTIPLLGIGILPALVALFIYALLPILRNTITGLQSVDPILKNVSEGIGLTKAQRLRWIELPLASPVILSGIRTASVINIGTATLAAFIGGGGLGDFIVTGLALNNTQLILQGAIPAALLAIGMELLFEIIGRLTIPKHLRG